MADPETRPGPSLDPRRERSLRHRSMAMPALLLAGLIAIAGMAWQVKSDQRNLATAYMKLGRGDDARRAFERAAELDPRYANPSTNPTEK